MQRWIVPVDIAVRTVPYCKRVPPEYDKRAHRRSSPNEIHALKEIASRIQLMPSIIDRQLNRSCTASNEAYFTV